MKKLSSTVLCLILVLSMIIGSGNKLYSTEKTDTKFVAILGTSVSVVENVYGIGL